jgi:hypothetical protein
VWNNNAFSPEEEVVIERQLTFHLPVWHDVGWDILFPGPAILTKCDELRTDIILLLSITVGI